MSDELLKEERREFDSERLLTPNELADWLNVSVGWVYDRTRKGGSECLPHFKLGKYVRFRLAEVYEYLERENRAGGKDG